MTCHNSNFNKKKLSDDECMKLNMISSGRFGNTLFVIGCILIFIEFDYLEKAIFESLSDTDQSESMVFENKLKAAKIAEAVGVIFLIAISIFATNSIITLITELSDLALDSSNKSNKQGTRIIAFFSLIKFLGYLGAAIGYSVSLKELEDSIS